MSDTGEYKSPYMPVPGTLAWAVDTCRRVKAARDGEALCFVRLGDFYESFGQDAVTAAAALDIILTSVPGDGGRVAMTGVPVHVAENYFARPTCRPTAGIEWWAFRWLTLTRPRAGIDCTCGR